MKKTTIISIISLALVAGFLAGIFGQIFSRLYANKLPSFIDLYVPQNQVSNREIIIQEAKKVIVEQDTRINQVAEKATTSVFNVYRKKSFSSTPLSVYSRLDQVSVATSLTSDGWLITKLDVQFAPSSLIILVNGEVVELKRIINDPLSGLAFIKVEANNLPVLPFAPLENITLASSVVIPDSMNLGIKLNVIEDLLYRSVDQRADLILSVEEYPFRIWLSESVPQILKGSPALNLNGEIAAINLGGNQSVKANYVNFALKSILKDDKIIQPYTGFDYIRTDEANGLNLGTSNFGVMVVSVSRNSSLFGLLKEGDIITAVENTRISKNTDLVDLIYDYRIGSSVKLKVVRDGQQQEVEYILNPLE